VTTDQWHSLGGVLSVALLLRLAVFPFSITGDDPYAQADAIAFAAAAERAAHFIANGVVPPFDPNDVIQVWGAFLSPF
jgi:hypothetical protein